MMVMIFIRRGLPLASCSESAIKAMMPPSPRLSARMMIDTYFTETTMISAQKNAERLPSTLPSFSGIGWLPAKTSFMAYSGLVPMSP